MPAKISGRVFNDINHNGIYDVTDTGISSCYIVVQFPNNNCTTTQTDSLGYYEFLNITLPGTYTIYETVTSINAACPPTNFTQPTIFNGSTTKRQLDLSITNTQINNNTNLGNNDFGHDITTLFGCSPFAWQYADGQLIRIDLATGVYTKIGFTTPSRTSLNAAGYNPTDGNIYGWDITNSKLFRGSRDNILFEFPSILNLPLNSYSSGDVDKDGYLYMYASGISSMYVVDVNPNRATYGLLVDPANNFLEDTSPFGLALSETLVGIDLSFNAIDNYIYMVLNSGIVKKINPTTGAVTTVTPNVVVAGAFGGQFFDKYNNLYSINNLDGTIRKYAITGNTATVTNFSSTIATSSNDGARCKQAPIYFAIFEDPIIKTATPVIGINDEITYTIILNNIGNVKAENVYLIDTIPSETSFILNSIKLDNTQISGNITNPTGVLLGDISVGVHTVTFKVILNTVPSSYKVYNKGLISFEFVDTAGGVRYSDSTETIIASTTIVQAILKSKKTVDLSFCDLGDQLTYTIEIENTGNTVTRTITLKDTIPANTSYISNSLNQDTFSISWNGSSIITLPNQIFPGEKSYITFKVLVNSTLPSNIILNNGTINYDYIGNNTIPSIKKDSSITNEVSTTLNTGSIDIKKYLDKDYAKIDDIIKYTIGVKNTGTTIVNINIVDTLPIGVYFLNNSVYINNINNPGIIPELIPVTNLLPNNISTITFQVKVYELPLINPILNKAQGIFRYNVSNTSSKVKDSTSNIVSTTINDVILNLNKKVDMNNSFVGDIVLYTMTIKNTGNTLATNVVFVDTLLEGLSLVPNSFYENGVLKPSFTSGVPLPLNNIPKNSTTTLTFNALITTIPSVNPILNSFLLGYNFIVNPITLVTSSNSIESNSIETLVNDNINPIKFVDKSHVTLGDTIVYTLRGKNNLSGTVFNARLFDTIPNGMSFINNSLFLNGTNIIGASLSPPLGLYIGTVPVGDIVTVTFSCIATTIPLVNPVSNALNITFDFVTNTITGERTHRSTLSNNALTEINYGNIKNAIKTVSDEFSTLNEVLTYTITFSTEGNKDILNFRFIDTIPDELTFMHDTLTFNNIVQIGKTPEAPLGFYLPSISKNSNYTISFKCLVNTIPQANPILNSAIVNGEFLLNDTTNEYKSINLLTNIVGTTINYGEVSIIKSVDNIFSDLNEELLYTLIIKNNGNTTCINITISDTLPQNTSFISNSIYINNINMPLLDITNIPISKLNVNETNTITFKVLITTLPSNDYIENRAYSTYSYSISNTILRNENTNSNVVLTKVNNAELSSTRKKVDKAFTICGDIVTYTFCIENLGNTVAKNVILRDTIPNGVIFIDDSIEVNGTVLYGANIVSGVNIGNINEKTVKTVSFK
ncbi:MAG: DUF6923 family protein, partial [Sarcina sp.]